MDRAKALRQKLRFQPEGTAHFLRKKLHEILTEEAAVDAAVVALGYSPNPAARSLVTRRTGSIILHSPASRGSSPT